MACQGSCYHNYVILFVFLTYISSSTQQGTTGTSIVYKAVLEDGTTLVVRRI
ncbi:hypothetical protein MKX01_007106, partial [Papaver californicum]